MTIELPDKLLAIRKQSGIADEEKAIEEKRDKRSIETIGKIVGEDFGVRVKMGKKWRYIFHPFNTIEVAEEDLHKRGLEYCLAIVAHEGAHRKISRMDFIPKEVIRATGFAFLNNAIEDPRVNNWVRSRYDGADQWQRQSYLEDFPSDDSFEKERKEQYLKSSRKHKIFGYELIRYWANGGYVSGLSEEVLEVLEKTRKYWELAYKTLPDIEDPTDSQIEQKAQLAYKIIYNLVWPEYQKLVEQDIEEEKEKQMADDMEKGEGESGEGDESEPGDTEESEGEGDSERKKEGDGKEGDDMDSESDKDSDGGKESDKEGKEGYQNKRSKSNWDKLSEEEKEKIRQKIKEKLEGMTEEERKEYEEKMRERAKKVIEKEDEEENEKLRGKLTEKPETADEEEARRAKEEEERKKEEEAERAREEARKELEKKLEEKKSEYDKAYEAVAPYIEKVAEELINILISERFPQFKTAFPGERLNLKGAMDWDARKEYRRLFERRLADERESFEFLLLVDLSASMGGEKIEETFKGVVLFAEALSRVQSVLGSEKFKVSIYGFQDILIKYKAKEDVFDDVLREDLGVMKKEVHNGGRNNSASDNCDGYCVESASKILEDGQSKNKFLIVLSDGNPCGHNKNRVERYRDLDEKTELEKVVEDITKNTDQYILGVGLGGGTEHVARYYKDSLPKVENMPNIRVKELAEKLSDKILKLIGGQ